MDTRRYYNRYQRTVHSNMPRQQVTVENTSPYDCLNVTSLAMVYAPEQCFENLYDMTSALMAGTIFKSLNKPFSGKRC